MEGVSSLAPWRECNGRVGEDRFEASSRQGRADAGSLFQTKRSGGIYFVAEFAETLHLVKESAATDAESLGGFGPVEVMFAQRLTDRLTLDSRQALFVLRLGHC